MKSCLEFFRNNGAVILVVMLGALFVQGCSTPFVDVNVEVQACEDDSEGGGPGACQNKSWQNQSATGFWNMDNDTIVQASENKFCTAPGGQKCRRSGTNSSCFAAGKADYCYSTYTDSPNTGTCFCACGLQ